MGFRKTLQLFPQLPQSRLNILISLLTRVRDSAAAPPPATSAPRPARARDWLPAPTLLGLEPWAGRLGPGSMLLLRCPGAHQRTHTHAHAHAHAYMHTHALTQHTRAHMHTRTHMHTHAHTRTRAHTCTHSHSHNTRAHTHTHTCTHARRQADNCFTFPYPSPLIFSFATI
jgi:hypothetical protein